MAHEKLVQQNKRFTLASWTAQENWQPLSIAHGKGVYFWDADGTRYLDWVSQVFNVNIGHGHPHVVESIQRQAARLACAAPSFATQPRARLGELLAEIAPDGLGHAFFTTGGGEAVENALKIARLATGRQKVLSRYRSYHGATFGAMSAGGDPRRLSNEPGVPWIVHTPDPYAYRSPVYRGRSRAEGDRIVIDLLEEIILFEGPGNIAALLLEGYSGTNGIVQGGEIYWQGIQNLCQKYGLLLIVDEVLSGFGRTGEWFGISHYPFVQPDLLVLGKGLTSGYMPLGAVIVSQEIASHFEKNVLWAGLTNLAHPLACAAAIANIEVLRDEGLVANAREMGKVLAAGLEALANKHEIVGEVRGAGLHQVLELVKNRETREPISPFNAPLSAPMQTLKQTLLKSGIYPFVKWNWLFNAPPLCITPVEVGFALENIDRALTLVEANLPGPGSPS